VSRRGRAGALAVAVATAVVAAGVAPLVAAAAPTQAGAPWPTMRHDTRNSGRSAIPARWHGDRPWSFATGRGIFSTPVIGADGAIYVGSADRSFYALEPDGRERWRIRTGGIIDAAAAIGRFDRRLRTAPLTFGSGDERLYHVRTDRRRLSRARRVLWTFRASRRPATTQLVNWWEGNVGLAPDGTIMAGNTGGAAYALTPAGRVRWAFQTGNSVWTTPAFSPGGASYWGSLDFRAFSLNRHGRERWSKPAAGYFVSSPALGADGTVYVASFDRSLYALDPATGAVRWSFATRDHVYASPALGRDGSVYVGSTDGSVYALTAGGRVRWRYDTGDAVRSSPVVGRGAGGRGEIVYLGSSDGVLYALDAATGRRRWSFDTTPADPVLADRDDLNGSPALGRRGVVIAGEHGRVWHVPYEYCRRARDARCSTAPGSPLGGTLRRVLAVSTGGSTLTAAPRAQPTAAVLNARLVVRRGGRTQPAAMQPAPAARDLARLTPAAPFTAQLSGDGQVVHVVPRGFLRPGADYRLRVAGRYAVAPRGAPLSGAFATTLRFRTAPRGPDAPLRAGRDAVTALSLRRLALPMPAFLTSVNQIGFDTYDLIAGVVAVGPPSASSERGAAAAVPAGAARERRVLLWVIGGRTRGGREVADPRAGFAFPLAGRLRGDSVILAARDLRLTFSFGDVPIRRFELRARLGPDLRTKPGAGLFVEVTCRDVPVYGAALDAIGLCNRTGTLPAAGTFLTDRYDPRGPANRRPPGVRVGALRLVRPTAARAGEVRADLGFAPGHGLPRQDRQVSLLLASAGGRPLALDYPRLTVIETSERGEVRRVRLRLPPGTAVPARLQVHVLADVFPLATRTLR
jgi:outer membrane protein assembly factor BamB